MSSTYSSGANPWITVVCTAALAMAILLAKMVTRPLLPASIVSFAVWESFTLNLRFSLRAFRFPLHGFFYELPAWRQIGIPRLQQPRTPLWIVAPSHPANSLFVHISHDSFSIVFLFRWLRAARLIAPFSGNHRIFRRRKTEIFFPFGLPWLCAFVLIRMCN